jgi:hypothetical protein
MFISDAALMLKILSFCLRCGPGAGRTKVQPHKPAMVRIKHSGSAGRTQKMKP